MVEALFSVHFSEGYDIGDRKAFHLDLYRTKNFREVKQLGITEIWGAKNTATIIEWANKISKHLPKKTIKIYFSGK